MPVFARFNRIHWTTRVEIDDGGEGPHYGRDELNAGWIEREPSRGGMLTANSNSALIGLVG